MEKISFLTDETGEEVEFFVLEQTRINEQNYILVTDSMDEDAEAWILKDISEQDERDGLYEIVDDDKELEIVLKVFEELLEDVSIER
ncbi:MAG: DUF1292 domain-containing protein [Suipraeoptans sp.]